MLAKVDLIFDKDVIDGLKGQKLTDQISAFALVGAPLPEAKDRNKADNKRKAIKDAIDKFGLGPWSVKPPHEEESTEEEKEDADDSEDSDNLFSLFHMIYAFFCFNT
jgi:ribosomal protein L12E/L44/L45/RPP1/RPP2